MPAIYTRPGTQADVAAIMGIIADARAFLKAQGINQWQGTYPDVAAVQADIAAGTNRLLLVDGVVAGTASLLTGPDPFYARIDGAGWWPSVGYMMIHRFAVSATIRGQHLSRFFMSNLLSEAHARGARDVRIDTHAQNKIMQAVITGDGFTYRGIVYLDEPVPERNAYQLLMD
ncbi:GNAT family N-acetyltransferase [Lacticaseibacillus daqingensis]|uniref:GNAT family N-acetyltransferase n=1 Tax=Lacticaseibacillus daqingensis TaxID=2486014 RepID=UPI000F7B823B|nr:GNAT family N-acetyltransferase [Lacticaseibacillus daqingensis]